MGDAIISVEELSKAFGQHEVLRKIDFNVEPGEIICIVGSSGSGKSTLLRCINKLETQTSGKIRYHEKRSEQYRRRSMITGQRSAWYSSPLISLTI